MTVNEPCTLKPRDDFDIFSEIYDEIAIEASERIPGYVALGVTVVEFRKRLWQKYRINKYQFAEMLQKLRDSDGGSVRRIKLYGSPIYLKHNWVECDGKHWTLIEVETEDHMNRMKPHRGVRS